jgi:ATP-dependent helicase/nuclease subunit A
MAKVIAFPASSEPAVSDAEAREQALNIRTSCIVEAPAGSGKTGLLVQRYLKLLADDAVDAPEEVLAVTFTRKATAELRERVLEQLFVAQSDAPLTENAEAFERMSRELALAALERSNKLNWGLLSQPSRLNIQTFDAVGMQIANALPMLSGSGGPCEPVENASTLHRAAARRTLMQLGSKDEALHQALRTLLLHRDGNLADCETLIAQMLDKREQWGELVPLGRTLDERTLDEEVRPRLERALETIVCSGLERAVDAMPAGVLEHLTGFAQRHAHLPGHEDKPSPIAQCVDRHAAPEATADCLDHWRALIGLVLKPSDGDWRKSLAVNTFGFKPPKKDLDEHKMVIASIQSDQLRSALHDVLKLPPARYPDDQWDVTKALFYVLRHALVELKLLFASGSECDFSELALAAREALRLDGTASDLALSAGGTRRHLLIDEMQDTSAGQYELIHLLTRSWDGATQTLFLVGDPKQSIYLFRAASVERFLRTMNEARFGDVALTPLRLTANFRSQPKLVDDFNKSFEKLFLKPEEQTTEAVDVPFVAATANRTERQNDGIVWHTAVLGEEALEDGMDHAQKEAQEIRQIIEERLAQPLPPNRRIKNGKPEQWRIAVLGHGRKHLSAVVFELKRAGIPFKAIDIDPLGERPEVLDVLALTRAVLHPADRIAWLAVLHAPWCGLGIADLLTLTGDSVSSSATVAMLVREHRGLLSDEGQALVDRAWPVLAAAVETLGRSSLAVQVERTWRSLGGDAALTPEQRTNVLRFLAVLREVEAEGSRVDLKVLETRLANLYAEPFVGEAQVELLTIHKSKGLEWDLVLVPGLERGSGHSSQPLLNWLEFDPKSPEDEAAVILAPISSKGTTSGALSQWLTSLRGQRELAERKRVFYVASTRAQEELHLFAAVKRKSDGTFATPATSSLLKVCWPAAEEHFAHLALRDRRADTVEVSGPAGDESLGYEEAFDIAAGASDAVTKAEAKPTLQRLPLGFQPSQRFIAAEAKRLAYPAASALQQAPAFERPDGSFGVRAFGNVVHRYLQLIAAQLVSTEAATLISELPDWLPRLEASLRGEGLAPTVATKEAGRALDALRRAVADPTGLWLLSPHTSAASEGALTAAPDADLAVSRSLRFDRTFLAGPEPLVAGDKTIWIIDFKTREKGSLSDAAFEESQRVRYGAQLESYAALRRRLPDGGFPIRLGLFYPTVPRLIHWESMAGKNI